MSMYNWMSLVPVMLLLAVFVHRYHWQQRISAQTLQQARESGLAEPASLHPLIDRNKCIGCKSCVYACPQQLGHNVLGLFHGKAELLEAANCIGHGACKKVCPVDAITLVFGTEQRGVDIPQVDDNFETNVPGIYIAGELGGMGLIRNAIEQGKSATRALAKTLPKSSSKSYQVVIVGAGPAGIAATLQARELGLNYLTLDQDSLGGTVFKYPRGKIVMTQPVDLPIAGKMQFKETSKEDLLEFWRDIEANSGIKIQYQEMVASISARDSGFEIKTNRGLYTADKVLLAIGRRGTPRKLGVPGEDHPKVVYQLIDPDQYVGRKVLIVGGGDSALEAALSIADAGGEAAISYRSDSFSRAKAKNRARTEEYAAASRVKLYMSSNVTSITPGEVVLEQRGQEVRIENEAVIVNAGGILPTGFLKEIGISVDTKYGTS
ncbi:MAG: NAD(P)-binding domain-containing protein [Gammaproteobacteria bacterium]|jgi:thioredoxin reductase/Pyruvate/2-oxoacid:ferredoxin oxidoreductase delta subunit|nr:NAD(P)-binding domain-containing protein [Gammaproteobacteria bacterium]